MEMEGKGRKETIRTEPVEGKVPGKREEKESSVRGRNEPQ